MAGGAKSHPAVRVCPCCTEANSSSHRSGELQPCTDIALAVPFPQFQETPPNDTLAYVSRSFLKRLQSEEEAAREAKKKPKHVIALAASRDNFREQLKKKATEAKKAGKRRAVEKSRERPKRDDRYRDYKTVTVYPVHLLPGLKSKIYAAIVKTLPPAQLALLDIFLLEKAIIEGALDVDLLPPWSDQDSDRELTENMLQEFILSLVVLPSPEGDDTPEGSASASPASQFQLNPAFSRWQPSESQAKILAEHASRFEPTHERPRKKVLSDDALGKLANSFGTSIFTAATDSAEYQGDALVQVSDHYLAMMQSAGEVFARSYIPGNKQVFRWKKSSIAKFEEALELFDGLQNSNQVIAQYVGGGAHSTHVKMLKAERKKIFNATH